MIPVSSVSEKVCHLVGQGTDITNTQIACLCNLKHYSKTIKNISKQWKPTLWTVAPMHRTQPVHLWTAAALLCGHALGKVQSPLHHRSVRPGASSQFLLILLFLALKTKLKLVNLINPFLLWSPPLVLLSIFASRVFFFPPLSLWDHGTNCNFCYFVILRKLFNSVQFLLI